MLILGFHGGHGRVDEDGHGGFELHDSAAALLDNGDVICAIEEERLNRIKHSNHFPGEAIRFCLNQSKLGLQDVDCVVTNFEESVVDFWARLNFINNPQAAGQLDGRRMIAELFAREFGVNVADKLRFCKHHVAHAWSAYGMSGFDSSLILTLDGEGDNRSGMVLLGEGGNITELREFDIGQSLGEFYTQIIKLLGYGRFDEYKVMGLAPYGDPTTYARLFERFYRLLPDGGYELTNPLSWFGVFEEEGILSQARRKGEPFTQLHKDLAAALQLTLERIVLHILKHYRQATGQKNLCLAGGVAHNCTVNGKALYSGLFDRLFAQPAAHDAGGALGAALSVLNEGSPGRRPGKLAHLYWGTDIGNDSAIERTLEGWKEALSYEWADNIAERTAQLLAGGAVVGWVQGRSEFGPRALGNRSILADPRPPENKQLINQMVKKREGYRPFAPSVLEERVGDFFETPASQAEFPFMIFVLNVRPEARSQLGAVTHIDGTARVQTVSKATNPRYWELIHAFEKITGVPILLNTSFNNNVEPIIDSVEEAIACFLTTGIHYLVVGNYLVSKSELPAADAAWRVLAPSLPPSRKLVMRVRNLAPGRLETVWELQSTVNRFFSQPTMQVYSDTSALLQAADGTKSLAELLDAAGILDERRIENVMRQVLDLWEKRAVILRPLRLSLQSLIKKRIGS